MFHPVFQDAGYLGSAVVLMLHLMSSPCPELLLSMRDPLQGSVSSRPPAPSSGQPGAPTRAARHTGSTLNGLKHVV